MMQEDQGKSPVYFMNMRADRSENIPEKFLRLLKRAGLETLHLSKQYVAIKLHFGERGNMAYLRPQYARALCERIKAFGGKPFLTDANTLYVGSRKDALEHLDTAFENGYSPFGTGVQVLIADGLKGTDDVEVPVPKGKHFQHALIGRAVMDADVLISLSHFKAHESTGVGGAIKNIGMGCGSRAGKMAMHNAGKPHVIETQCIQCAYCTKECAHDAIGFPEAAAYIDHGICVGCGRCLGACPVDAIVPPRDGSNNDLTEKIAEYTAAILQDRPHFHIVVATDISPFCDCHSENDTPVIPNVGIFASMDPVAVDVAAAEACLKQPVIQGSYLDPCPAGEDYFQRMHPSTDWRHGYRYAEALGLGKQAYDLIEI